MSTVFPWKRNYKLKQPEYRFGSNKMKSTRKETRSRTSRQFTESANGLEAGELMRSSKLQYERKTFRKKRLPSAEQTK